MTKNPMIQIWKELSITYKLAISFGAMLVLTLAIALTGYYAFSAVRRQTEAAILTSMEIQRLVLKMESELSQAQRLKSEFFLQWPKMGFSRARDFYTGLHHSQIARITALSARLKKLLTGPHVTEAVRRGHVNFIVFVDVEERTTTFDEAVEFYLRAADLSATLFDEAIRVVAELGDEYSGAVNQLNEKSQQLRAALEAIHDPELLLFFGKMALLKQDYLLTQQRPIMASVSETAQAMRSYMRRAEPDTAGVGQAIRHLTDYVSIARKIAWLNNDILRLQNEFKLQSKTTQPISDALIRLGENEVANAQAQIGKISRYATMLLITAVGAAVVLALLIAFFLNHSITRQIVLLTKAASQVKAGRLDVQMNISQGDEIGQLFESFNTMASRIRRLIADLEEQKETAEKHLQRAIESISEGLCLYDANDRLVLSNRKYIAFHEAVEHLVSPGVSFEALTRAAVERGLYPEAAGQIDQWVDQRIEKHRHPKGSFEQPLGDGHWLQISEYKTQEGETVGIYRNIDERKHTEETLRRQNEYLTALHETSIGLISRLELNDLLLTIVRRAGQLAGTSHGNIYLFNGQTGMLEPAVGRGLFRERLHNRLSPGKGLVGHVYLTNQPHVIDDYDAWPGRSEKTELGIIRAIMGVPLTSSHQPIGVICLAYDHESERTFEADEVDMLGRFAQLASIAIDNARLYAASIKAREVAEYANRTKSAFLANMSHELRTPLNTIIGYSELLMEESEDHHFDSINDDLKKIHIAGSHLLTIISDILDLSKIEANKMELHLERFDVQDKIEEIVSTMQPLLRQNDNSLDVRYAGKIGTMHTDLTKLRQSLLNLLSNACRYTEHGSVALAVSSEVKGGSKWVVFRVSDTGAGINSGDIDKVFSPFYQADGSASVNNGGTGLGLAITKRLCEILGGQITVQSEVGRGSTFTIRLPATIDPEGTQ